MRVRGTLFRKYVLVFVAAIGGKALTLDPGTWFLTGNLNVGRDSHTATLLPNAKVLVAGGLNSSHYLYQSELYKPKTNVMPWLQLLLE
jgi:hypothetical protein